MYQRVLAALESSQFYSTMTLLHFEAYFPPLDVTLETGLHSMNYKVYWKSTQA